MVASELGIAIGTLPRGRHDAITDVPGVRVGHCTVIEGHGRLVRGVGPIRTGVTIVLPHEGPVFDEGLAAGAYRLNGNGEMTGLEWLRESGLLVSPIGLTNTHSLGVVRDAIIAHEVARRSPGEIFWALPVVAETYDGLLNDIDGFHIRNEHVEAAFAALADGRVEQGSVGAGTGTIAFGFKAGIGSSSRVIALDGTPTTIGVLVQANHGRRERLRVNGLPVGQAFPVDELPLPGSAEGLGSIIGIVATDAPLFPDQCRRLAQRAAVGVVRGGGSGENGSGDLFLAFSTAARFPTRTREMRMAARLADEAIDPLFDAVIDATEEAVLNALLEAETMIGRDGLVAHKLPVERLLAVLGRERPGPAGPAADVLLRGDDAPGGADKVVD